MIIKLNQSFKNFKGESIKFKDRDEDKEEELTLGKAIANILLAPQPQKDGFRVLKVYELSKKFYEKNEIDLDRSDFVQIKERVENSNIYSVIVLGQILEMFEEANEKKTKKEEK
jgi:hypothetical protein